MNNVDQSLYKAMNRFADRTPWAHGVARFYAKDGIVVFAVLLLVGWWLGRISADPITGVATACWAGAAALVALAINQPIASAVARARPYASIPNMHILVDKTTDFSFASDHATAAGAVAVGLLLADKRLRIAAAIAALAMAFVRVYAGAHFPGDVVAGLVLGGGIAAVFRHPALRLLVPAVRAMARSPLQVLVVPSDRKTG